MSMFFNFFDKVVKGIPALIGKIGTILLGVFGAGILLGYNMALEGASPLYFFVYPFVMAVMWMKLDWGAIVFAIYLTMLLTNPVL